MHGAKRILRARERSREFLRNWADVARYFFLIVNYLECGQFGDFYGGDSRAEIVARVCVDCGILSLVCLVWSLVHRRLGMYVTVMCRVMYAKNLMIV